MKKKPQHLRNAAIFCSGILVFFLGRLSLQYQITVDLPPVQSVSEVNPGIPLVTIHAIEDGVVYGAVNRSEIRIISEEQVATVESDMKFSLNIEHLGYLGKKAPVIEHHIAEWAQFVASRNGKYFYALDEKQAKRLSVPNRVYFPSVEEATAAGYLAR